MRDKQVREAKAALKIEHQVENLAYMDTALRVRSTLPGIDWRPASARRAGCRPRV